MTIENPIKSDQSETQRPYARPIDLIPGGCAVLVNNSFILAVNPVNPIKTKTELVIYYDQRTPVLREKYLGKPITTALSPGIAKATLRVHTKNRQFVYVGEREESCCITYLSGNSRKTTFKLEAAQPICVEPLAKNVDLKTFLSQKLSLL